MSKYDEIEKDVSTTIQTTWNQRKGNSIPKTEDIALSGGAVELEATFLYADLAASSKMVKELDRRIAAKILKSFLSSTAKLIKHNGGKVVSFDGDRVMGVFHGDYKNSSATKCALQINYIVINAIRAKFEAKYESVRDASFRVRHGVGIDSGSVLAVRGGVRGSNDIIWIERAPNLAAKLSDLRETDYPTFITSKVYNKLSDEAKLSNDRNMWERRSWTFLDQSISVYRSNWSWKP